MIKLTSWIEQKSNNLYEQIEIYKEILCINCGINSLVTAKIILENENVE